MSSWGSPNHYNPWGAVSNPWGRPGVVPGSVTAAPAPVAPYPPAAPAGWRPPAQPPAAQPSAYAPAPGRAPAGQAPAYSPAPGQTPAAQAPAYPSGPSSTYQPAPGQAYPASPAAFRPAYSPTPGQTPVYQPAPGQAYPSAPAAPAAYRPPAYPGAPGQAPAYPPTPAAYRPAYPSTPSQAPTYPLTQAAYRPAYPPTAGPVYQPWQPYQAQAAYAPTYRPWGYQPPPKSNAVGVVLAVTLAVVLLVVLVAGGILMTRSNNPQQTTTTTQGSGQQQGQIQNQQDGNYKNDGYTVPDPNLHPPGLPMPTTYTEATTWTQNNPFYSQPVPVPVRCEMPDVNPSTASKADVQTYLNGIVECLMRVWAPELKAAGFNASRPSVTIYTGTMQTACGKMTSGNAGYCSSDQQVYYSSDLPMLFPNQSGDPFMPMSVIAHEFGHAIQAQSGILYGEMAWQQRYLDDKDQATSDQMSRRAEMQADCFAGEFMHAVQQSSGISDQEMTTIKSLFYGMGDDQLSGGKVTEGDHGLGKNRQAWFTTGLTGTTAGVCNTFDPSIPDSKLQ